MSRSRLWQYARIKSDGPDSRAYMVISGWGTGTLTISIGDREERYYSQDSLIPALPRNGFRDMEERIIKLYYQNGKEEKFEGKYLYETEDEISFFTDTGERKFNYPSIKVIISEKK